MPRYRVKQNSWLDGRYYKEGDTVEFDGVPGRALELIEPVATDAVDEPAAETEVLAKAKRKKKSEI